MARMGTDEAAGLCLGKPSCAGFSNPSTSELARDFETPSLILLRKMLCSSAHAEIVGRKLWIALGLQAGMCCEKASASPLASVFSITYPAFA